MLRTRSREWKTNEMGSCSVRCFLMRGEFGGAVDRAGEFDPVLVARWRLPAAADIPDSTRANECADAGGRNLLRKRLGLSCILCVCVCVCVCVCAF